MKHVFIFLLLAPFLAFADCRSYSQDIQKSKEDEKKLNKEVSDSTETINSAQKRLKKGSLPVQQVQLITAQIGGATLVRSQATAKLVDIKKAQSDLKSRLSLCEKDQNIN